MLHTFKLCERNGFNGDHPSYSVRLVKFQYSVQDVLLDILRKDFGEILIFKDTFILELSDYLSFVLILSDIRSSEGIQMINSFPV
eukprot:snap_masked-scaffold_78-processed-gene-0.26-mRNA-1 protein AED:1.00 eAED:1.00 QI:0/0/0/0/1/1/3/0/84